MVCKEEVCHWFRYIQTYERLDLLCKLLHLCSSHELRFISAVIEDQARTDYNVLRDSAFKANDSSELKKLSPNLFSASDRSALIVYLSLLNSMNMVCAHVMFNMLNKIEAQRIACHLHATTRSTETERCSGSDIDSDTAEDIILMYTMATYHPAFTIAQRIQLSDYLQKAQTYFTESFMKNNPDDTALHVDGGTCPNTSSSTGSSCTGSPYNHTSRPQSDCPSAIQSPVHVSSIELKRSQWDSSSHRHVFHMKVSWSNGEVTKICRSYHELQNFHVELLRLFPKDSGAHRQQRHIPYLPQEKRNRTSNLEFEEDINKYMKQLSTSPAYIMQCEHMTNFFRCFDGIKKDEQNVNLHVGVSSTQVAECELSTALDSNLSFDELASSPPQNVAVPTAHALTTVVQRRFSYSSVVASPLTHHSPIPSPLSSPHVSPSSQHLGSLMLAVSPSTKELSTADTISSWLKNLRLHKYASSLSKYSWQQLAQLDDKALDKEGLTDGAKKKFRKQLEAQLAKLSSSTNGVVPVKFTDPHLHGPSSSTVAGHAISPVPFSPVNSGSPTNLHQNSGVHLPLTVMTKMAYSPSITNSVGSTNSIGSSSPAYSDYSGISPPSSPRSQTVITTGDTTPKVKPGDVAYPRSTEVQALTSESGDDTKAFSSQVYEPVVLPASPQGVPTDPHSPVVMVDVLHGPNVEGSTLTYSQQTLEHCIPSNPAVRPFVISGPPGAGVTDMDNHPGVRGQSVCLRPRIPLTTPTIRACSQINNTPCLPPLLPNPPVSAATLGSPRMPNSTNCPLEAVPHANKPPVSAEVIIPSNLESGGGVVANKLPVGYGGVAPVHNLLPRAPSLMGPAPGCHIIQRPSNLGIHLPNPVTNNNLTYSIAHLPTPTNGPSLYETSSTPVSLPPTNIPPPMSFHNSVSMATGTTTTSSSSANSPIPGVLCNGIMPAPSQVSADSVISPPGNSPTLAAVTTSNSSNSGCTCHCNCQQCSGTDGQSPAQPTSANPASATPPTTVQLTYPPHPPIPWPPNAIHIPGSYPHPGGFISTSSNGLITANPNFPPFSPQHLPHSPYSLPSSWTPEMLFDPRNYAMLQATAASQGVHPPHIHPLYQPYVHGYPHLVPNPNSNNKGHSNPPVMCFNCGGAGHMAHDCKGPTMDGIVRSAQFHLNLQPRNDAD